MQGESSDDTSEAVTGWLSQWIQQMSEPSAFDAAVDYIDDTIAAELPEVVSDMGLQRSLDASTTGHLRALLVTLGSGTVEMPPETYALARTLAHRGFGVEMLLQLYRVGLRATHRYLADVVERSIDDPDSKSEVLVHLWSAASEWLDGAVDLLGPTIVEEHRTWLGGVFDLERAANGIAWAALMNSVQACISVERVYVEASVHDRFVELLTEKFGALRQGIETMPADIDVGAMATPAQAEIVRAHVEDAVARGAAVVTGGNLDNGRAFFESTVLTGVDHSMVCMTEETFGPIIPLMKVRDADEGIRWANDNEYGLSATVWTRDEARGARLARCLEVGAVNINDAYVNLFCFGLPHGGWKSSGIGARLGGAAGMRKYCRQQAVTAPRIPLSKAGVMWFPYSPRRVGLVARILRLLVVSRPLELAGWN